MGLGGRHAGCWCIGEMRVLEARFHFQVSDSDQAFVVGRLVWDSDVGSASPVVEPSASLVQQEWPATILSKLKFLIEMTAPDSYRRLLTLRSRYWSFVDVTPDRPRVLH